MTATRRWGLLLAYFISLAGTAVCTAPRASHAEVKQSASPTTSVTTRSPAVPTPPTQPPVAPVSPRLEKSVLENPGGEPRERIALKHIAGQVLYLTIENEFREGGGVQPLLSYTTTLREKRSILQRVLSAASQPSSVDSAARIEWECDRYEAREKAMKDESEYDSLRHLYPPPALYSLGNVDGTKFAFVQQPDGTVSQAVVTPGPLLGEATRGMPSKTVEKCLVTVDNLTRLVHDTTAFYLPPEPVGPGATWSFTRTEHQRNVGTFTTRVVCTLRSLRDEGLRRVAVIDVGGEVSLAADKIMQPTPASRPGQPATAPAKPREFKLDRGVISGQVRFDVTHGELIEMSLRREQAVGAEIDGQSMGPMKLVTSMTQLMKAVASRTPPTRPMIVGGKKPPVLPKGASQPSMPTTARAATTPVTSQPGLTGRSVVRPPTPQQKPFIPTTQPLPRRAVGKGTRPAGPYHDDAGLAPPTRPAPVKPQPAAASRPSASPTTSSGAVEQ